VLLALLVQLLPWLWLWPMAQAVLHVFLARLWSPVVTRLAHRDAQCLKLLFSAVMLLLQSCDELRIPRNV
jgi:hypothetical protein